MAGANHCARVNLAGYGYGVTIIFGEPDLLPRCASPYNARGYPSLLFSHPVSLQAPTAYLPDSLQLTPTSTSISIMAVASNGHSNGSNGYANGNGKAAHEDYAWATRVIHAGSEADEQTGAVIPPLSLATTFKQSAVGVHKVSAACIARCHRGRP